MKWPYDLTRTDDGVDYNVKAIVGFIFAVVGYGSLYIVGGLIVALVPIWIWVTLGLPS